MKILIAEQVGKEAERGNTGVQPDSLGVSTDK